MNEDKIVAVGNAMATLNKIYGKGTVVRLGDSEIQEIEAISTGSLGLDIALGIGGLPKGRITEIYGPESSGKTTIAIQAMAECNKEGGSAAFIDVEHSFSVDYAKSLGVDIDNLIITQPSSAEQALEIMEGLIRSGAIDIIVLDSVAGLVPMAEIEGEMGDSKMGLQARLMSQAFRKLTGPISKANCCCIFINQLRHKIGQMYGSPEVTTGGNALKFYSSVRLDVRRSTSKANQVKDGEEVIGNPTTVKVIKNKVAPPFKEAKFDIIYGKGVSKVGEILDIGLELKLFEKTGSWYSYDGNKIGQGRKNACDFLNDNLEISEKVESEIREKVKSMQIEG